MASFPPGVPTSTTRAGSIGRGGVAALPVVGKGANGAAAGFATASGAAGRRVGSGGSAPRGGAELLWPRPEGGPAPRDGGRVDWASKWPHVTQKRRLRGFR